MAPKQPLQATVAALLIACLHIAGCLTPEGTEATVVIDFNDAHPDGTETLQNELYYSPDLHDAAGAYTEGELQHPDHFTVHDLMVRWSNAINVPLSTSFYECCGFSLASIDGVEAWFQDGAGAFWELIVNDVSAQEGMSTMAVQDGDIVTWRFTTMDA